MNQPLTAAEYRKLQEAGLSDDDIRADGYEVPSLSAGRHVGNALVSGLHGASLGLDDEIGGLGGAVLDKLRGKPWDYTGNRDAIRDRVAQAHTEDPKTALLAELAGGFVTPGLGVVGATSKLAKEGGVLAKAWQAAKAGAKVGGVTGAVHGLGSAGDETRGEIANPGDVASRMAGEGVMGGVVGGTLGGLMGGGLAAKNKIADELRLWSQHGDVADLPVVGKLVKARRSALERQAEERIASQNMIDPAVNPTPDIPVVERTKGVTQGPADPVAYDRFRHGHDVPTMDMRADPMREMANLGGDGPIPFPEGPTPPVNRGMGPQQIGPLAKLRAALRTPSQTNYAGPKILDQPAPPKAFDPAGFMSTLKGKDPFKEMSRLSPEQLTELETYQRAVVGKSPPVAPPETPPPMAGGVLYKDPPTPGRQSHIPGKDLRFDPKTFFETHGHLGPDEQAAFLDTPAKQDAYFSYLKNKALKASGQGVRDLRNATIKAAPKPTPLAPPSRMDPATMQALKDLMDTP